MNQHVNTISNRLSLRSPQRDSLEILARICDIISLEKDGDLQRKFTTNYTPVINRCDRRSVCQATFTI